MRLRRAAVPSIDSVPAFSDEALLEQEQSALDSERSLAAEAHALSGAIEALDTAASALAARAAELHAAGVPAAEFLLARIHTHQLQPPDLSAPMAQAVTARAEALSARARAVEAARVLLRNTSTALAEHRAALAKDSVELEKLQAAEDAERRAEATRREAEARARAEASARATAAAPVHPTPTGPQPIGRMSPPRGDPAGRRDMTRVPMQAVVDLSSDTNLFTGFSTNVSEGGLFVATVNVLPVGTPVDLSFGLPDGTRLTVQGEVRWTREINDRTPEVFPGVGVRFLDLSEGAASALHRFVTSREPLFYPD
jgi:uncharacterized protein (TIGR02266 family)